VAAEQEGTLQRPLLCKRGLELVLEGLADAGRCCPVSLFYPVGTRVAMLRIRRLSAARRSSPCLKAGCLSRDLC
jgi:hypothetical protein